MSNDNLTDKERFNSAYRHLKIAKDLLDDRGGEDYSLRTAFKILRDQVDKIINTMTKIMTKDKRWS